MTTSQEGHLSTQCAMSEINFEAVGGFLALGSGVLSSLM